MLWIIACVVLIGVSGFLYRRVDRTLRTLHQQVAVIRDKENRIMATLDDLALEVSNLTAASQSAISLLGQLSSMVAASQADPAKIQAVLDGMKAATQALSDAVAANTPPA